MFILERSAAGVINTYKLQNEINELELSEGNKILYIETIDQDMFMYFENEVVEPYISAVDATIAANLQNSQEQYIINVVRAAQAFGNQVIFDFTVENVMLGITQLGLTTHVRRTTTPIITALTTGSLYDAIAEVKLLNPDDFDSVILTPTRLLNFRNKIETYLGMPLAQTWDE